MLVEQRRRAARRRGRSRRASGCSSPASSRISVDLPLPLGPSRPSFVPGERTKLTSRNSSRPPSDFATRFSSSSLRVLRSDAVKSIFAAPCCVLRCRRSARSDIISPARSMRPFALVVRAFAPAAEPLDLPPHAARQRRSRPCLRGQKLLALLEEVAVRPVVAQKPLRIRAAQLDDPVGDRFEKPPVVADDQRRERRVVDQLFQPRMPSRSR